MKISASKSELKGTVTVPGSKSHTIRALLLAAMSDGVCTISNPLPSADCLSTCRALPLIGASVEGADKQGSSSWTVHGAGAKLHLPSDVVNVGNSGSLLYFLSPIAATFNGWSVFTGDESIRKRPVHHVVDALNQLGAKSYTAIPGSSACPLIIQGPISAKNKITTSGTVSSQYISGLMMAALRLNGTLQIELTDPKETPYLTMTQKWLESVGAKVNISEDFKNISVQGPLQIKSFDTTVPSDWEAVAFPLVAALITDSDITITGIDGSGTQGDQEVVNVFKSLGADIEWNKSKQTLRVRGLKKAADGIGRLTTENLPDKELHVNLSGYPDAICAVAALACFTEGTVCIEDISVCRRKETDRIKVLHKELEKLGAVTEEGEDFFVVKGHSPVNKDGSANPQFALKGAEVESYKDHRVAMALACMGLGLGKTERVIVKDAECCAVSFPDFFKVMGKIGADFNEEHTEQ